MANKNGKLPGTIYRREDGNKLWVAQIMIGEKRKSKSFKTYREAKDWLWEMRESKTKWSNGVKLVGFLSEWIDRRNPLSELKDDRTERQQARDETDGVKPWKETTYLTNLSIMQTHVIPYIDKDLLVTDVDREWMAEWFTDLIVRKYKARKTKKEEEEGKEGKEKKVGARTRQIIRNLLHLAFENAVARKIIERNPVDRIHVDYRTGERKILTRQQIKVLLEVAGGTWYENILPFAITSQLRKSEILGETWDCIDWDNSVVYVVQQLQRLPVAGKTKVKQREYGTNVGSSLVLSTLKTERSRRTVKLGKRSMEILRSQWELIQKMRTMNGWVDHNLIFPNQRGGPMEHRTLNRAFKGFLKKAGLDEKFRFHDLRHTGLSYVQSKKVGGSRKAAQERAGHTDPKTTGRYSHTTIDDQETIAKNLDDFLFGDEDEGVEV